MGDLIETIAREMCALDGIDPDLPCPGVGRAIPVGETWPAWKVREAKAQAATAQTLERVAAWLERQAAEAKARRDHNGWAVLTDAAAAIRRGEPMREG